MDGQQGWHRGQGPSLEGTGLFAYTDQKITQSVLMWKEHSHGIPKPE